MILQLLPVKFSIFTKRTRGRKARTQYSTNFCDGKDPLTFTTYCIICTRLDHEMGEESRSTCSCVWLCTRLLPVQFQQEVEPTLGENLLGYSFSPILIAFLALTKCVAGFLSGAGLPRWLDMPWTHAWCRELVCYLPSYLHKVARLQFVMWISTLV